ncbi:hypothetical protein N9F44_01490 [Akkermansiaceae bacterium]|nr:hypothetical protein [Akkermansiaceae bacterium]MDB4416786.1 hypothetical protein [bacterium]MDA8975658.1 hypothetical protein [Akkermansiaceae bacterium]MDB4142215.1 hypothetical protein [Akkermansiaceae bacterium]MDB4356871.1 hypothetical protein [Akkermansiaceae bacterium]
MTKSFLFLAVASAISLAAGAERTWTSADGERTMTAQFISSESEMATINRNGHVLTFKISRLSEADQAWVQEQSAPLAPLKAVSAEKFAVSSLGKALTKAKIREGDSFAEHTFTPVPKLFFLYYSASW